MARHTCTAFEAVACFAIYGGAGAPHIENCKLNLADPLASMSDARTALTEASWRSIRSCLH
jgi:hypothetical protein